MAGDPAGPSQGPPSESNVPSAAVRRRQVRRIVVWTVVAVVAACGLGWGIQTYLESRHPEPAWTEIAPIPSVVPWEPNRPAAAGGSPISAMGLRPLAGDPGGIAPPSGATRASAFERRLSDGLEQQARYEWWGQVADAAAHYQNVLRQKGFTLASDRAAGQGQRILFLTGGNSTCLVRLQTNPGPGRLVIIGVVMTVASPDAAGKGKTR
jgi:hypothetical protein